MPKGLKSMRDRRSDLSSEIELNAVLDEAAMRDAVSRIQASDLFSNTPRLREFLDYVANEAIRGNKDSLRAKSIAHFVYDRDPVDERSSANVVRVEARRLRRLLEDYYDSEGRSDPVRVHIDKGGYAPRFERQPLAPEATAEEMVGQRVPPESRTESPAPAAPRWRSWRWLAAGAGIGLAIVMAAFLYHGSPTFLETGDPERIEREALMDRSPAALEAANLTSQARGLIYPIFDAERQRLTTEMFRTAISVDPSAAGAHAGAAQTLASLALLSIEGPQHDALLGEANHMLDRALDLAPSQAWTQSAAGWVAFVESDFENAMRYSQRAVSLAPNDGNVLDFYGVVAVMSGNWEEAIFAATQDRQRVGATTRYADQNILAAARFHMGEYREAARIIEENTAQGGPLSAPVVTYLAAAYQALGRTSEAQRMLALLEDDWPGFPAERVLRRLHREDQNAMEVIDRLRALGWEG